MRKGIKLFSDILCVTGWSIAFLFFMFRYRFAFNYEIEINDHYYLVFSIPFLLLAALLNIFSNPGAISLRRITLGLAVITGCLLLLFSKYYSFGNEYFVVLLSVLFINGALAFISNKKFLYAIPAIIMAVWFIQLYIGMQQWLEAKSYGDSAVLAVKGSLQNSGVYACYLAIHLTLLNIISQRVKNLRYYKILYWVQLTLLAAAAALSCFLIVITQSRTAYIALFITLTGWAFLKYGTALKQKLRQLPRVIPFLAGVLVLAAAGVALYYLFGIKKMSAMGRVMKTEIALQHITDRFWLGTGIGRFSWYYPQWQAQYFKETPNPPKDYFLSAGESYVIFNEYLQWLETVGVVGTVITLLLLFCFFKAKSENHKRLLNTVKLMVVAIMACGFTSYSLHINTLLLLLAFCFTVVFKLSEPMSGISLLKWEKNSFAKNKTAFILQRVFFALGVLLLGFSSYKGITALITARQWQQMTGGHTPQAHIEERYAEWYSIFKDNGKFLTDYGTILSQKSADGEAIAILEQARQLFISRASVEAAAVAYSKQNDYPKAIESWDWVCNYVPNRFTPRYELLKLYQVIKDTTSIKRVANSIITIPVKVSSLEVDRIRKETIEVLKDM